jgi:hypothetical protein
MKHLFLGTLILLSFNFAKSQNLLHLTAFAGVSNYQGDLQDKKFTFEQAGAAFGVGMLYEISEQLYFRGNVTFGKINGDDKKTGKNAGRNLSFSSPVTDIHLGMEYELLNPYERSLVPFIFTGISVFHFNPSTVDYIGGVVKLQPLGTEGQGFYQGRTKYNLTQIAIPFGGGVKYSVSEDVKLSFEIGFRKTFTDYLDDVSTTYADKALLLGNNGQKAVDLSYRGDEVSGGSKTYPTANSQRGNPDSKDWYYYTGVGVSFRLTN